MRGVRELEHAGPGRGLSSEDVRADEMRALGRALLRGTGAARWTIVELAGDPGTGKSTVLSRFARLATTDGRTVRIARPDPSAPLALWHDLLGEGTTARQIRTGLEVLAGRAVLLVDDAHRADPASAEILAELVRRPPRGSVLLVVAHRPRQLTGPVGAALASANGVRRVELGALPPGSAEVSSAAARRELLALNPVEQTVAHAVGVAGAGSAAGGGAVAGPAGAGGGVDAGLIAAVADLGRDETYRALDRLTRDDLLRVANTGAGFRFRDSVVRAAAYDLAPAGWRLAAHARADRVLRERGAPATARAAHLARFATPGDPEAVTVLRRAAADALHNAPADAATWLTAALDLAPASEAVPVLRDLAHALALAGRLEESRRHLHRLLSRMDSPDPAVAVLTARTERLLGRHDEADALLRKEMHGPHRATAAVALAAGAMLRGDLSAAGAWARTALTGTGAWSAGGSLDVAGRIGAIAVAALAGDRGVRLYEAAEAFDGLLDNDLAAVLDLGIWLPEAEVAAGHLDDARRHTERMLDAARAAARPDILAVLCGLDARLRLLCGDLDGAGRSLELAADAARRSGSPVRSAEVAAVRVWLHLWLGDPAAAARAGAAARERDPRAATRLAGPIGDRDAGDRLVRVRGLEFAVRDLMRRGAAVAAAEVVAQARQMADATPTHRMLGYAALAATHTLLPGDPRAAAEQARVAAGLLAETGDPLGAAHARRRLATALIATGDAEGARQELERARRGFAECRASALAEAVERDEQRLASAATVPGIRALTPRETQVVTLMAEGLTNKEIARRLYLSPGTVSIHVGRAYAKLGVSRRAAAVARLAEAGLVGMSN